MPYYNLYLAKTTTGGTVNYQEKTVVPVTEGVVVTPDSAYNALSKVTIVPEFNLIPNNIKNGVQIYGVTGNFVSTLNKEVLSITISTVYGQTITVPEGVQITGITIQPIPQLTADVIKNNVKILDVAGEYVAVSDLRPLTFDPLYNGNTIVPTGYDGFSTIIQNPIPNLTVGNIVKGVTIAGLTGEYVAVSDWISSLNTINDYAFKNTNITSFYTPHYATYIGVEAVHSCDNLIRIDVDVEEPSTCQLMNACFANNIALETIVFHQTNYDLLENDILTGNKNLINVYVPQDFDTELNMKDSNKLDIGNIEDLIHKLKDLSGYSHKTIILHEDVIGGISSELMDIAVSKNWNITKLE